MAAFYAFGEAFCKRGNLKFLKKLHHSGADGRELIQMQILSSRELLADEKGARMEGNPLVLKQFLD